MALVTHKFKLDLTPGAARQVLYTSQGDIGRPFEADLYWNGSPWTATGTTASIRGKKPDDTVFDYTATVSGTAVTFETTEQMTIISGPVECELVFSNDGDIIASANFVLMVEDSPYNPDALSESDIPTIGDLIEDTIGGDIRDEVDALIEAHPELMLQDNSVTTPKIAAGAVTSAKVDADFLKTIENAYVTPEQFGAVGNGTTDDTVAIQAAIDNAEKKAVYFRAGATYKTTAPLQLNTTPIVNNGTINYNNAGYALILAPTSNVDGAYYKLGRIISAGGGLLIDTTDAWVQYLTFDFTRISCGSSSDCVRVKVVGAKWANEIRFLNGRFYGGVNAVYIDHDEKKSNTPTSHFTFERVGFEGCTNCLNIPEGVSRTSFTNCRAEESLTNVVLSRAQTTSLDQNVIWYGVVANGVYWKNCNNYRVVFVGGFINERGVLITNSPILLFNGMLHGLQYWEGYNDNVSNFGAYTYDEETTTQEVDFAEVYDYETANIHLWTRPFTRRFAIGNNTSATITNIYLDDRMFLPSSYAPTNSYLLQFTISPHVVVNIYDKRGGTIIRTITGGSTTTYPRLKISKASNIYSVEQLSIEFKTV